MKINSLVVLLSLAAILAAPAAFGQMPGRVGTLRCHYVLDLSKGGPLSYTTINGPGEMVTLIEAGKGNLWIQKIRPVAKGQPFHAELMYVPTGEKIVVDVKNWEESEFSKREYTLTTGKGESVAFNGSKIPEKGVKLSSFVASKFGRKFVDGLTALKDVPVDHPDILTVYPFVPLWGRELLDKLMAKVRSGEIDVKSKEFSARLVPVDCAFDARFGFPCAVNEISRGECNIIPVR